MTSTDGNETTGVDCHGMPGDQAEYDHLAEGDKEIVTRVVVNLGKALGAYERRLSCGPGRFDEYVHGNGAALSDAEKLGAELFVGKAHCTQCHSGPYFTEHDPLHGPSTRPTVLPIRLLLGVEDWPASQSWCWRMLRLPAIASSILLGLRLAASILTSSALA